MLSYQFQSILLALMSLVAGIYEAGSAALPGGESRSSPILVANESRVDVGPTDRPSLAVGPSSTEVATPDTAIKDGVPDGSEPVDAALEPATAVFLIPVSRPEAQALTNTREVGGDAVDYLSEIGFGSEFGASSPVLHRWREDLRIKVHGEPTETDLATLRQVAQELNSLIPDLMLEISDVDPNVDIHFLPEPSFTSVDPQYVPVNLGFFRVWWDSQGVINRGRILVSTQGLNQAERSHLIREELTQILGLFKDSWQHQDSIFYQGWTSTQEYSPLDREIIRLLYSPRLETGMVQTQFRSAFAAD